jgi:hypothetical protein
LPVVEKCSVNHLMKILLRFLLHFLIIAMVFATTACDIFAGRPAPQAEPFQTNTLQSKEGQAAAIAFAEKFLQKAYAGELEQYLPQVQAKSKPVAPAWELAKGFDAYKRTFGAVRSRQFIRIEPDPPLMIHVVFKTDFEKASAEETVQLLQENGQWKVAGLGVAEVRFK